MTRNDEILAAALDCAGRGWPVVMLYQPTATGCNCRDGDGCKSPGKHPRGKAWDTASTSADEDTLLAMFEKWPASNIGLLLGQRSQIIDIEFDTPQGRETAERLFGDCFTPSYKSGRSIHRLFRWSNLLPNVQKVEVDGLEIRIGNNDKATQSVLPPSRHPSGVAYEWLPGLSPAEVELADVPQSVLALINNVQAGDKTAPLTKAAEVASATVIPEGSRNNDLHKYACRLARFSLDLEDALERQEVFRAVSDRNTIAGDPPLDESELRKLVDSAVLFVNRERKTEKKKNVGFTVHGLQFIDGEWEPGNWKLTLIYSDPLAYRLHVPAWYPETPDGKGNILIDVKIFLNEGKVAETVFAQTGKILLDEYPGLWASIWNGKKGSLKDGIKPTRGLRSKLIEACADENAPPAAKRRVVVAEYLAAKLNAPEERETPDTNGVPSLIEDGRLKGGVWFRWLRVWQEGFMTRQVEPAEAQELLCRLGLTAEDFRYYPSRGAGRVRYCVLQSEHMDKLEQITQSNDIRVKTRATNGEAHK